MPFVADRMEYVDGPHAFVEASLSVRRATKLCKPWSMRPGGVPRKWIRGIRVSFSKDTRHDIDLAISKRA